MNEHEHEPVPGLPKALPANEQILWQGSPRWQAVAVHRLHLRKVAIYFVLLGLWAVVDGIAVGAPFWNVAGSFARPLGLGTAACGLIALFAILVARTTVYTITNRRLVLRIGIALTMTINLPFKVIRGAALGLHDRAIGVGSLPIELTPGHRVSWLLFWPHVRPWRLASPQPTLVCVNDADRVAGILKDALASAVDAPQRAAAPTQQLQPRQRATAARSTAELRADRDLAAASS